MAGMEVKVEAEATVEQAQRKLTHGLLSLIEVPQKVRVSEEQREDGLHISVVNVVDDGAAHMLQAAAGHLT